MSFLSDLFSGKTGNLTHDLNPSNIFSDAITDVEKNPLLDIAAIGAIALPFAAPELLGAGAGLFGADVAADATAGAIAGDIGATSLSAADAAAAALPVSATLDAGTAPFDLFSAADPASQSANAIVAQNFQPLSAAVNTGADPLAVNAAVPAAAPTNIASSLAPTAPTLADASNSGILSQISNAVAPVTSALKTASPIIGATSLGYNLYQGYQQKQQLNALNASEAQKAQNAANIAATDTAAAQPLLTSGQALTQYLQTGTLPPDFQASVQKQVAAAKAAIIQGYAARGQNTNPQQNSALQQELSNVDTQAQDLTAKLESTLNTAGTQMIQTANSLLTSGLNATQLSAELPIQVAKLNSDLNAQMSQAIASFSAALNGSGTPGGKGNITLTLPQNIISNSGQANA